MNDEWRYTNGERWIMNDKCRWILTNNKRLQVLKSIEKCLTKYSVCLK